MTERLHNDQLDREIRVFLAWQAEDVVDAPNATEMALRIGARTSAVGAWTRPRGHLAWVALALLLIGLAAAASLASGLFPPQDVVIGRSYEAVFLRLQAVGSDIDVIVVAVNAQGVEREIVHLPTRSAWVRDGAGGPNALLGSLAAVSPTGLLALPRTTGDYMFGWSIVDLYRPEAAPIVVPALEQDFDVRTYWGQLRPAALWGPDERVAIFTYERGDSGGGFRISMLDGRTGVGASFAHPDASILPYWTADGSGIIATSNESPQVLQVFRMDGSLGGPVGGFANDGHDRRYGANGAPAGTFADFDPGGYRVGSPEQLLTTQHVALGDVAWTADGLGRWVLLPSVADRRLRLERRSAEGTTVAILREGLAPAGAVDTGRLAGLAPDDSMLIVGRVRHTDITADGNAGHPPEALGEVFVPGTGLRMDVAGYFAGWLEVLE